MTTAQVFGLLMGWLGGWVVLRWMTAAAQGAVSVSRGVRVAVALTRAVSWGCFLALSVAGLWAVAVRVTR